MRTRTKWLATVGIVVIVLAVLYSRFVQSPHMHDVELWRACVANLEVIQSAKERYSLDHNLESNGNIEADVILTSELLSTNYIRCGCAGLHCPLGGHYAINRLSQAPTCTYASRDSRHAVRRAESR